MTGTDSELGNQFRTKYPDGKPLTFTISADKLVPNGWCHVNRNETVDKMMELYDRYQGTGKLDKPEMLKGRVFGGITREYREGNRTFGGQGKSAISR